VAAGKLSAPAFRVGLAAEAIYWRHTRLTVTTVIAGCDPGYAHAAGYDQGYVAAGGSELDYCLQRFGFYDQCSGPISASDGCCHLEQGLATGSHRAPSHS
jgi:hypothetical protein